ncbi:MAG: hypothetical protein AVDCRST_MAG93-1037 [uncultured Chloroflexia bacterium]|uniref:Uncharacterized protein n=1 Tax=uncultured Chloroflexia bacterium TaxID=1672391 RepID=A0A6J4HVG6_9CHLR|nr:MAG: hypothetical protein AVDCRST_MAG93-1037 [uncultured Chloroflexia bacterium]
MFHRHSQPMEPEAFISQIRDHYLEQFKLFVEQQRLTCAQGAAEVKLSLGDESEFYEQLYCADFIRNDGEPQIVELQPDRTLNFDVIEGSYGDAALEIAGLRWDDVVIHYDAPEPVAALAAWFDRWFDPADERHVEGQALGNVIHSLLVQPNMLSMDLGSAQTEALWEVLDLLEAAGSTSLRIDTSVNEEG